MKKIINRLLAGVLSLAAVFTTLPASQVQAGTAYCIDINTDFISGYKTRSEASTHMSADQIEDAAF